MELYNRSHRRPEGGSMTPDWRRPETTLLLLVAVFACLIAVPRLQAGTTGKIAGVVKDAKTGEPLPGANVFIEGLPLGAATDEDGTYFILNVPPGTYAVTAQLIGYQTTKITDVKVMVDLTTRLDFELSPEAVEGEEVVVVAKRPMIQKDVVSTEVRVSKDEIQLMPVDNFNEVVEVQAGVVEGHFRGGRLGEVMYLVDGIPVNDNFNNAMAATVENSFIQELQVISGTFSAEYGQAMSGVVNIITREGSDRLEGHVNLYAGNYLTPHDKIFWNLGHADGKDIQNLELSLSGPVPLWKKLKFFVNSRLYDDNGRFYGRRVYTIEDDDPFQPHGDSAFVPMGNYKSFSLQGKLSYYLLPQVKLSYTVLLDDIETKGYDHAFRLAPDGIKTHFQNKIHQNFIINHTLSKSTFYTLKLARTEANYRGYVFEDPFDPRYVIPERGNPRSGYTFRSGGNQSDRYDRTTTTYLSRLDVTSQFQRHHKLGLGAEFKQHEVENFYTRFRAASQDPTQYHDIVYPEPKSPGHEFYFKKPREFAAYLQDVMEYEDLVVNAGVRFDYFDPNTEMPADLRNPLFIPQFPSGERRARVKTQVSPRLGVAFPISSQGVIHVSYGHFFQIPNFDQLYRGIFDDNGVTKTQVASSTGESGALDVVVGNPDLRPQQTISYEVGFKQVLIENLAMELTAYYRDIRNLVDTEILETYNGNKYARFINRDYGNVRGIILSFEKRFARHWGMRVDYTYQFAEGNASDPQSVFQDNQSDPPNEPEKKMIRLDWDQRHTLNFSFAMGTPGNWNMTLLGKMGSGTPYTADKFFNPVDITFRNDRNKPAVYTFDLRADKQFSFKGTRITAYLFIDNLFDRLNEKIVYGSSGRAGFDYNTKFAGDIVGLHTIEEFVLNPAFYDPPRQFRVGIKFGF
ncbi:MAG: TonB-dependent receptor [Calditrichaeota bacterium]|nr:MAG: TonB-dependent receptor [Calditrichota bacterium]